MYIQNSSGGDKMLRVTFYTSGSLATRALYTRMPWHTVDDELLVCSLNVIRAEMQLKSMHSTRLS
jgi:hypothetical protein